MSPMLSSAGTLDFKIALHSHGCACERREWAVSQDVQQALY